MQLKGYVLNRTSGGQIFHLEDGFADGTIDLGEHVGDLAANHQLNELVDVEVLGAVGRDVFAVAVDGDVVRDAEDLVHLVRDVDNGDVLFLEVFDDAEQVLDLGVGQG